MKRKIFAFLIAIILVISISGCAKTIGSEQYFISGRVLLENGNGLAGVSIKIGNEVVATTAADGVYTIKALTGKKSIKATLADYKMFPAQIDLSYERKDADFNATAIGSTTPEPPQPQPPVTQTKWPVLDGEVVYDDFDSGVDSTKWDIVNKKWGTSTEFQGTVPTNVNYTEDGALVLTSKGRNNEISSERNTTACVITKEAIGPGKIDVVAKIAPRLGICSAIWLFYYGEVENGKVLNQEIDVIEVPGQSKLSLECVMNTHYQYENETGDHAEATVTAGNDGEWHKYSIEWSVKDNFIKYYTDDVLTHHSTKNIPNRKMQLWIGTWMPDSLAWIGVPDYEQADMLVDRVSYTTYNETEEDGVKEAKAEFLETKVANEKSFPKAPIVLKDINYISNGSFSGAENAWSKTGDLGSRIIATDYLGGEKVFRMKNVTTVSQTITAMYKDFTFNFHAKVKMLSNGGKASVKIEYLNYNNGIVGTPITYNFAPFDNYDFFECKIKVPAGGEKIRVSFTTTDGTIALIDDVLMMRTFGASA